MRPYFGQLSFEDYIAFLLENNEARYFDFVFFNNECVVYNNELVSTILTVASVCSV